MLLWFLAGLGVGIGLSGWFQARFRRKLKPILHDLHISPALSLGATIAQLAAVIHQQQQSHQQVTQQLETWQQILQTAPISYLQVDEHNQLYWSNLQACELLSIDPGQGQKGRRLLLELVRSYELDRLISEARVAQKPCQKDWRFHPSSADSVRLSQEYPLRGHAFPLLAGHVGIFLENRQEAVTLAQERDRWASDVAHELKTPLTSIRLVAETLHDRLDSPLRTWVARLLNETIRLSILVQDLLDLGRVALKLPQDLMLKTLNLASLIQSAWLNLEPLASKKQLRLDYTGPNSLLIQADEGRLFRVLLNLFDNSIKYSPANQTIGVRVNIGTAADSSHQNATCPKLAVQVLQIEVIDAGPGFPKQALPHVFERFYRADPARSRETVGSNTSWNYSSWSMPAQAGTLPTSRSSSGSGLGLAIVQQIIEAHGGSVTASNHPETQGAWVKIVLPWQPAQKPDDYRTAEPHQN